MRCMVANCGLPDLEAGVHTDTEWDHLVLPDLPEEGHVLQLQVKQLCLGDHSTDMYHLLKAQSE